MNLNPFAFLRKPRAKWVRDEVRSMLANPPDWLIQWADGGISAVSGSGIAVNETTALTYSAVFQAVRIISESVASLPLLIYKQMQPIGRQRNIDDPRYALLNQQPNSEMPAYICRETITAHALLSGNGYAEIERNGRGDAVGLYPIHWSRVTPKRINGEILYEVANSGRAPTLLPKSQMFHLRGLGGDGLVGYSVIRLARESFGLGIATEQFGGRLFGNGARIGGWIKLKKQLTDRAKQNLRESLYRVHQGVENAHKFGILDEDMDFTPSTFPPEDAQFLETRRFQVTDVARWFNLPAHKLNDLERSSFSNIEQQSIDFVVHSLRPWLIRWEAEAKIKLFPEENIFCEHFVDGMLRGDTAARATFYSQQFNIGAISQNEIRESEGRNPIPDGDRYYVPVNLMPSDLVDETIKSRVASNVPPEMKQPDPDKQAAAVAGIREAHMPVIRDALSRCVRREAEVLRKAAKKPETFAAFADKFYGEHAGYVRQALTPPIRAAFGSICAVQGTTINAIAIDGVVNHIADSYATDSLREIKTLDGSSAIDGVLSGWEARKAEYLASKIRFEDTQ